MSRFTVTIGGKVFAEIASVTVSRDLQNIAGTFEITLVDEASIRNALIAQIGQPQPNPPIRRGQSITIAIDGETILIGWINKPKWHWSGDKIECHITGRDRTGDLVDCAALPYGPAEFKGVDLLYVANTVCAPFGIPVRADVDIGAPFDRLSLHKHMNAMPFLESGARQRSILLTSDGVGGLLLTRGGTSRAPAALAIGDNVEEVDFEDDEDQRFSDCFVMQDTSRHRHGGPGMTIDDATFDDEDPDDTPGADSLAEEAAIGTMGHAIDPEITRWRPSVRLTRSQSGMSTVQEQAEWACRVAKGQSAHLRMAVLDYRAGPDKALWRPNQVATVYDPYSGLDRDMLIAGVTFTFSEDGEKTSLRLVGVTAYDRINEAERRHHYGKQKAGPGQIVVAPLSAQ